ncbi:Cytochrome c class I [Candidatus Filomicrobium marinum]|uniref:Cytochrome c class I n=2 Tax=Filomicrobium TaxID=119044 RepID=A0A0D6JES1_9HYPH|nr:MULTISPECIES: cytochrome c family protein [Filomicrobium]MCV0370288.1 cytochrome c family protein [Filomicrobium sp.]CFX22707.1 Cytochrome c class I [Candidatus Filomicrobium marinum]CPR18949.1 Cytochrome c class I [Candidatus Filomicrobium marinum]SDO12123.1 cytochrome c [Filomicrobium insigne]
MDSFELSKIAGAVLTALLLIFGGKTLIELSQGHGGDHGEHAIVGYTLPAPAPEEAGGGAAEPAAPAFDFAKVAADAPAGDVADGEATFKKCMSCHSAEKGGPNKVGPDLWGIVGRPKASHEGFTYSAALKEKGGDWTLEDLAHFLHKPKSFVSGTKMVFPGVSDEKTLTNLLAYLNSLK